MIGSACGAGAYLRRLEVAEETCEYLDGDVWLMPGMKWTHHQLMRWLTRRMLIELDPTRFDVLLSELGVCDPGRLYAFPDLAVSAHPPTLVRDGGKDFVADPLLIVEVLSQSTAAYDRGPKFEAYSRLKSLQTVAFVWSDQRRVETFERRRVDEDWSRSVATGPDEVVRLPFAGTEVAFPVAELFAEVRSSDALDPKDDPGDESNGCR